MADQIKNAIDYSLYLVTDSTQSILGGRGLIEVVKDAVDGGKRKPSFSITVYIQVLTFLILTDHLNIAFDPL